MEAGTVVNVSPGLEPRRPGVVDVGRPEQRERERLRGVEQGVQLPPPRAVVLDLPGERAAR